VAPTVRGRAPSARRRRSSLWKTGYVEPVEAVKTHAEALRIAEAECASRGLRWHEPQVKRGWHCWRVSTPGGQRGGNAVVSIGRRDGVIRVRRYNR